jgi:ferritin
MVKKNYYELINGQLDPDNINFLLEDKLSSYQNDNRPVISKKIDLYSDSIYNIEKDKIIKSIEIEKEKNIDKLINKPLKEIIKETTDVTSNFLDDYNNEYIKTKNLFKNDENENYFKIYMISFMNYINKDFNGFYLGISIIFISLIINLVL